MTSANTRTEKRDGFQGSRFGVESWGLNFGFVCGLRVECAGFGGEGCDFIFRFQDLVLGVSAPHAHASSSRL